MGYSSVTFGLVLIHGHFVNYDIGASDFCPIVSLAALEIHSICQVFLSGVTRLEI